MSDSPSLMRSLVSGLAMGSADAVPGVSGGTIALILGIYERLLDSLNDLILLIRHPLDATYRRQAISRLPFLIPLGIGLLIAYYLATKLLVGSYSTPAAVVMDGADAIHSHLQQQPPAGLLLAPGTAPIVFAFFFGLVIWSVQVPWRERKTSHIIDLPLAIIGAVAVAGIALSPAAGNSVAPVMLMTGGALAISAMLLPGISGSLVLLVLGLYQPVAAAVHERSFGIIAWTALGIAIGGAAFVPTLRWLLHRAHDRCMSLLTGLMVGSLVALWPWKGHYLPKMIPHLGPMNPQFPSGSWWWPVCAAIAGMALIMLGERWAKAQTLPCPPGG